MGLRWILRCWDILGTEGCRYQLDDVGSLPVCLVHSARSFNSSDEATTLMLKHVPNADEILEQG